MSEELEIQDQGTEGADEGLGTAEGQPEEPAQAGASHDGEQTPEDPGAKPNRVQKRIGELTRRQREAERERDYWREVALAGKTPSQSPPFAGQTAAQGGELDPDMPRVEQFASYEEFVDARADWRAEKRIREHEQAKTREQTVRQVQEKTQAAVAKAAEKFEDFEDVALSPELAMTPIMAEALLECENFAELAYHLGQHPEEAKRISRLSPAAQAREIGKLEVRLATGASEQQQATRKVSNAPAPVKPVGAKGAAAKAIDLNDPNLPIEVWEKEHDRLERDRQNRAKANRRN